jgi:hypothetical protein
MSKIVIRTLSVIVILMLSTASAGASIAPELHGNSSNGNGTAVVDRPCFRVPLVWDADSGPLPRCQSPLGS